MIIDSSIEKLYILFILIHIAYGTTQLIWKFFNQIYSGENDAISAPNLLINYGF